MKKYIIFLLSIFILFSCSSDNDKGTLSENTIKKDYKSKMTEEEDIEYQKEFDKVFNNDNEIGGKILDNGNNSIKSEYIKEGDGIIRKY